MKMNYHMVLTRRCNLNCVYCHGGEETGPETEIQYTLNELENFLSQDTDSQLMFYGGEPTLRSELMMEMMDRFPNARFMLQTNGLLLNRIENQHIKRFHSILVSIDGDRQITDFYRSDGVYNRVIENVQSVINSGYEGDLVARMAVSEQSDIYRDVRYLLNLGFFKHVHWQLNAIWAAEGNWTDFDSWVDTSYNPGITQLVDEWIERMEEGTVEGIVPFLPIMHTILTQDEARLRCGSGLDTFAIHVDGSIGICPISPDWEFSIVGHISDTNPEQLRNIMEVEEPCPSCEIFSICGGRCLFSNKQRLWGEDGFTKVCDTVKHLVKSLQKHTHEVQDLIDSGIISLNDFTYPEFNNGCEIIP